MEAAAAVEEDKARRGGVWVVGGSGFLGGGWAIGRGGG